MPSHIIFLTNSDSFIADETLRLCIYETRKDECIAVFSFFFACHVFTVSYALHHVLNIICRATSCMQTIENSMLLCDKEGL